VNTAPSLEQVQALAAQLPPTERRRLAEQILEDLESRSTSGGVCPRYDWMTIRGIAPNLLEGEDAQHWVSRTRREADEQREKQWRHTP
jgi:hypothetical protein